MGIEGIVLTAAIPLMIWLCITWIVALQSCGECGNPWCFIGFWNKYGIFFVPVAIIIGVLLAFFDVNLLNIIFKFY